MSNNNQGATKQDVINAQAKEIKNLKKQLEKAERLKTGIELLKSNLPNNRIQVYVELTKILNSK